MKICPNCGGGGAIPIGEHFVSRDMALDAGCPELEGSSMGVEWAQCEMCGGIGTIEEEGAKDEEVQDREP